MRATRSCTKMAVSCGIMVTTLAFAQAQAPPANAPDPTQPKPAASAQAFAIGAVAGNAGKGAAVGATTGVLAGAAQRRRQQNAALTQQQQSQQQVAGQQAQLQAATKQNLDNYNRAFKACMQGRGYTVN